MFLKKVYIMPYSVTIRSIMYFTRIKTPLNYIGKKMNEQKSGPARRVFINGM